MAPKETSRETTTEMTLTTALSEDATESPAKGSEDEAVPDPTTAAKRLTSNGTDHDLPIAASSASEPERSEEGQSVGEKSKDATSCDVANEPDINGIAQDDARAIDTADNDIVVNVPPSSTSIIDNTNNNADNLNDAKQQQQEVKATCMALNDAFEALERVRQANVQIEFGESVDPTRDCLSCLREHKRNAQLAPTANAATATEPTSRVGKWRASVSASLRTKGENLKQRYQEQRIKTRHQCLTCGSPVCTRHQRPEFRRNSEQSSVPMCTDCSRYFSGDYLQSILLPDTYEQAEVNALLDVYDRSVLSLKFSTQFIPDICVYLQENTNRHNKIGVGASATGLVSGVTGVVAAGLIFTPVGAPLLIASMVFGGGATVAAAGSEAVNLKSQSNQMADRILVLDEMVHSIARLFIVDPDQPVAAAAAAAANGEDALHASGSALSEASSSTTGTMSSAERPEAPADPTTSVNSSTNSNTATKTSTARRPNPKYKKHWTRGTMTALRPLTAGALSAVAIVTESRELKANLAQIAAGNPCEKAERLKVILEEEYTHRIPETNILAEYVMERRRRQQEEQQQISTDK